MTHTNHEQIPRPARPEADILAIAERITSIQGYGDMVLHTRVAGLGDDEDYHKPLRGDRDQRPFTTLHSRQIASIEGEGADLRVNLWGSALDDEAGPVLPVADIEFAQVDNPFGNAMPLHGRLVPVPNITMTTGIPALRWAKNFIEYGLRMRVETEKDP
jgi:hypothetical protein